MSTSANEIEICMRCWRVRHWTGERFTQWTRSPREILPWGEQDRERYVMCYRCICRLVNEVAAEKRMRAVPCLTPSGPMNGKRRSLRPRLRRRGSEPTDGAAADTTASAETETPAR